MKTSFKPSYISAVISLLLSTSTSLMAQEAAPAAESAEDKGLEKITVTALRRITTTQEIPVSVTAIGEDDLEVKQIRNVSDLQYQIPNISLATNTGTANGARIFLRGVGEDESRISADPAVGIYVDGVYVGRQVGALFDLVDLERLEVLRGPQGTLYGRNSNGGAIKLVSKKAELDEDYGIVKFTVGNNGRFDARLTGNLGLTDSTAIRTTFVTKTRDGFHTLNPNGDFADIAGTEVGDKDMKAFRIGLYHEFNSDWKMNLAVDYTKDSSDPIPASARAGDDADNDLFTVEPVSGAVCSAGTPANFLALGCFTDYHSEVITKGLSLNIQGQIGDYDLTFLTGLRTMEDDLSGHIGFPYTQKTDQDQLSQEITLSSNYKGAFNFVTGVYYFTEDAQADSVFVFPFELGVDTEAKAIFFQGDYEFTDTLTLTSGIRYTQETKEIEALAVLSGLTREESRDFSNTTFNVALNNQFTEDVMGYVSYSTGFKSGGWSPDCFGATGCFLPVDEEELDAVEFGLRSDWFDNRLRINATYFMNNYEGLQIASAVPGLGFTRFNVDGVDISGVEVELTYEATDSLIVNLTLGTIDAEYTDLTLDQAGGLTNNGTSPGCNGVVSIECASDLELKNAPEYKVSLGFTHSTEIGEGMLVSHIDFSAEDDSYSLVANAPEHSLTSVGTIVNARISYEPDHEKWRVSVWGQNLADHEYARVGVAQSFGQYASDPLTFGADFEYRF
ncbi:TonB-dependent receptor [Colwellia sp. UCD-KL20]|uniref:TonB-dependent receptor n=1 Tax=Colwellia sp. UCD-KL20 TaxID=1917165 RepID=UPI0009713CD1|nr:TonB-dependent receptor [Colwellia sp. UCD-KL20]